VIKVKLTTGVDEKLPVATLDDFGDFEAKMIKIKNLKSVYQNLDKTFLVASMDELELKGKKMSAKRLKRVFKKVIIKMIEEVEK